MSSETTTTTAGRRASVAMHLNLLSTSVRRNNKRPVTSSLNKASRPPLSTDEEVRQRRVILTDTQVQAATSAYESHGGLTAHFALMLQRLSLPHDQADELLAVNHVSKQTTQLPLATFLSIVRDVYESVLEDEAALLLQAALTPTDRRISHGVYEAGASLSRAHRWADADADHAFEALHAERSPSEVEQQKLHLATSMSASFLPPINGARKQKFTLSSPEDNSVIDAILSPMREQSYAELRRVVMPRPENPLQVRAFLRLGAVKSDDHLVLDTATLNARCEAIGLSRDEQQAVVNLFDEDCSGEIDFDEFKAIMTGNLAEFGLGDAVVTALQKLMQVSTLTKTDIASSAEGNSAGGGRQSKRAATLFSRIINSSSSQTKRRQSIVPAHGIQDNDDDDDEDEGQLLQQMQSTVDSCKTHSRDNSSLVEARVKQFAADVRAKDQKESPRSGQHHRTGGDETAAAAASSGPSAAVGPVPPLLGNSYSARAKQRKSHFSLEDHRRREEARRQKLQLPPRLSVVKETYMHEGPARTAIGDIVAAVQPHNVYAGMIPPHIDSPARSKSSLADASATAVADKDSAAADTTTSPTKQAATARALKPAPPPSTSKQVPQPNTARRDMIGSRQGLYTKILTDRHDMAALLAPLRRTRSPAEVSRMLDAHRTREDRLTETAANRLDHFREVNIKALLLYQEQQAIHILAAKQQAKGGSRGKTSQQQHSHADTEPTPPRTDRA